MSLIDQGINKGYIKIEGDYITYVHQDKRQKYTNPEEIVQAEAFLKLIITYGYPENRIVLLKRVTMGSTVKEVDIVVYNDDELTQPHIVVECKKEEVSELEFIQAVKQASSYAYALSGTIKYLWITSGIKNEFYIVDKDSDNKQTIPVIPKFGVNKVVKYQFVKGGKRQDEEAGNDPIKQEYFELETIEEKELTNRFKQAHNALWAGGELNPSEAFDELDKLIFCKIWDERKPRKKGEPYDFQIFNEDIPKKATEKQIAEIEHKISTNLFKRINALYEEGKKRDPEVFKENIRLNHKKVKTVVNYLEEVNLSETDLDSKGKAFETFMGSYFRGDFGQFFTPRSIVKFIVNSLPITNEDRVIDTSCGSGGFLLYALDKVRNQANIYYPDFETNPREATNHHRHWHDFAEFNLFGIEINEQIARTAKMNMIIHDDGHTNVIASDGLLKDEVMQLNSGNNGFKYNSFDYIITNPPFGSSVKQTERAYLNQYSLGNKNTDWLDVKNSGVKGRANQSTEVLFIEQGYHFLKEGGFLAVVLPDGVLTNSSLQYVRDEIEEWFRIVSVVSMPQTAFAHTGAGVKSSVLFLRKWDKETTQNYRIQKRNLQETIKDENNYLETEREIQKEKRETLKLHIGFENELNIADKKQLEKTEEFKVWKKETTDSYNQKVTKLKDDLTDFYFEKKQKQLENQTLNDYQILMAIAEDIGYNATGKSTGNNELDFIEDELSKFIAHIIKSEKI
jgi:type I restriction enzyme M protein